MREQLLVQQKLATVGQLTATVSHELHNPLGTISIRSLKERLAQGNAAVAHIVERIERNVKRCDNVITDLLDYSRTRPGNPEPTPIAEWLRALAAEQTCPDWLELDLDVDGMVLVLDQDRFRRVILNLIENAIQAMAPHATGKKGHPREQLTLRCRRDSARLVITVADTGPGMVSEVLARGFEPLFSTKTYGVGLGLPNVKQIMEHEGGGIEITSQPGRGTDVVLWLPLTHRMSRSL